MKRIAMFAVCALLSLVTLQGCESAADKCLGTGWVSTDLASCEAACNDTSLKAHHQYESCYFAGLIYQKGPQLKKHDPAKARALFTKACKLGGSSGCQALKDLAKSK